jgi:tetratricopeptide (TPR) repeat protein
VALSYLGTAAFALGNYQEARQLQQEALTLSRQLEDRFHVAYALQGLGRISHALGEFSQARGYLDESLRLSREIGDLGSVAQSLIHHGDTLMALGEAVSAQDSYTEAIRLAREGQAMPIILEALAGEAERLLQANDAPAACELLVHVLDHPAATHAALDRSRRILKALPGSLPSTEHARARSRPFDRLLNDLLSRRMQSVAAAPKG